MSVPSEEEVRAEMVRMNETIRELVQPLLLGSPLRIFAVANVLAELSVEIMMGMRTTEENAYDIGDSFIAALAEDFGQRRKDGVPPPSGMVIVAVGKPKESTTP